MTPHQDQQTLLVLEYLASMRTEVGDCLLRVARLKQYKSGNCNLDVKRQTNELYISAWIDVQNSENRDIVYWTDIVWNGSDWRFCQQLTIDQLRIWDTDDVHRDSFEDIVEQARAGMVAGFRQFEGQFRNG